MPQDIQLDQDVNAVPLAIARIFREALTCPGEAELGRRCLGVAETLTQSQFGFIGEINRETGKLDVIAVSDPGWLACEMPGRSGRDRRPPVGLAIHGIYGRVLLDGRSLITNDPPAHPDNIGLPANHPPLRAFLGVPLIQADEIIGLIGLGNREGGYGRKELEDIEGIAPAIVQAFLGKRAEAALRESELRYRTLVEATSAVTWSCPPSGLHVEPQPAWMAFTGQSAEEMLGLGWTDAVHPDDLASAAERWKDAVARGEPFTSEHRIRRHDGVWRWMSVHAAPIRDGDGRLVEWTGMNLDITERKCSDEGLEAERARLQAVLDALPVAVWIADADGTVIHSNQAVEQVWGKLPVPYGFEKYGEYKGWWADTHARIKPRDWALARAVTSGEVSTGEVIEIERFDGTPAMILNNAAPVFDQGGRIIGGVAVAQDITALRHAEEALGRERALLQSIFDNIPVLLVLWDPRLGRFTLNRHAETVLGWSSAEANDGDFMSRVYPDPEYRAEVGEFMHALQPGFREWLSTTKDGDQVPIEWANVRLRDDTAIGIGVDLRKRKQAEEALVQSREGLRRLAGASLAIMAKSDIAEMLQAIAEAALALTDARLATCVHGLLDGQSGIEAAACVPGAPACPPGEMLRLDRGGVHMTLAESGEPLRLTDAELRTHARSGSPEGRAALRGLLGVPLRTRDGRTDGMILATDKAHGDFTSEDEALLEQLATVASLALQHVEARLSLEASDRRKDTFLAMLGHELRNPLAPIRNSLYLLDRAPPGGDLARRAQSVIERQVTHLTSLVDDLLDVTRIARGKIQLKREPLNLAELVGRTVEDYRALFAQSRLALALALPEEALWMDADRTRLAQVIGNLLANAAKFTPPGGRVSVGLEHHRELGQAVLRVRDTGIGIAPEMLAQVFEPFTQADTTLERSRGGLGLGLAMVKGLVELHGGHVGAQSAGLGAGTELTVRLPLARIEGPAETPPERRTGDGERRQILLIEDNRDAAESLRLLLELLGHTVELAPTGTEGVAKAKELAPDLILCDIGLPGMDGYAVARTLRLDPRLRVTRLVALSGYAAPEDSAKAREAGFDAHHAKPLSLETLETILAKVRRQGGTS
jgi:PAS domain S-box-containing protein